MEGHPPPISSRLSGSPSPCQATSVTEGAQNFMAEFRSVIVAQAPRDWIAIPSPIVDGEKPVNVTLHQERTFIHC